MTGKRLLAGGLLLACAAVTSACGTANGGTQAESSTPAPSPSTTLAHKPVKSGLPGTAEIEIYRLHRQDDLVTLDFGLRNKSSKVVSVQQLLSRDGFEYDVSGVYLVDGKNKKKYLPARYAGECVCSSWLQSYQVSEGQTQYLSATYGAPPSDVTSVDISVPHVGTFSDVKIS